MIKAIVLVLGVTMSHGEPDKLYVERLQTMKACEEFLASHHFDVAKCVAIPYQAENRRNAL